MYVGYFNRRQPINPIEKHLVLGTYKRVVEPEIAKSTRNNREGSFLYVFKDIPHWSDYFVGLRNHRDPIRDAIYDMLALKHRQRLAVLKAPVIGIHVRLGDFRALETGEDFSQVGQVRTPLSYFIDSIDTIRQIYGSMLPVTVFSDGCDDDLTELLMLPNVSRAPHNSDVVDLLLLSKAKIVIPSSGSTFSYWSAFLSDAAVLHHPDHKNPSLRPDALNRQWFEGLASGSGKDWPTQLIRNIETVKA
jgi:hypothetical protein